MLISYVGVPFSGKSTVACEVFSSLKTSLVTTELLVEEARRYIAFKRYKDKLTPQDKVSLTDEDQQHIAFNQWELEKAFKASTGPNSIILSDSSVYNSSLYMSHDCLSKPQVHDFFFNQLNGHYDLVFYCAPVNLEYLPIDANRIHNKEEILQLEDKANKLISILKSKNIHVEYLMADQESRVRDCKSLILNKYTKLLETTNRNDFIV